MAYLFYLHLRLGKHVIKKNNIIIQLEFKVLPLKLVGADDVMDAQMDGFDSWLFGNHDDDNNLNDDYKVYINIWHP